MARCWVYCSSILALLTLDGVATPGDLKHIAGHLQDVLTKIQSRLQWGSDKYDCTDVERLAAEQNCEVVIAADEYYR